jgi:hypothetical protein
MTDYILVLVDRPDIARELNGAFFKIDNPNLKIQAFSFGQQMHGLRFRHTRPTQIIDLMSKEIRNNERYEPWYRHCVEPNRKKVE